ncbi:MAG: hypothetical protein K2K49_00295 [Duncaniella sp.]|nr:hypothetical protein [Duncaniella sp.]
MKTRLLMVAAVAACALAGRADSTLTTIVDGVPETRELVKMTLDPKDPDNVTLHFADASTLAADLSLVSVLFDHSGNSLVEEILATPELHPGVYNLKGQRLGDSADGLMPGLYIVNGQKTLVK